MFYISEDDFWSDYYDAQDAAEKEAQRIAESSADLWDFESEAEREQYIAEKMRRLENIAIPDGFDYHSLQSLTIEARQKLSKIRPATIGQASRIPGVSPADINVLLVYFGR